MTIDRVTHKYDRREIHVKRDYNVCNDQKPVKISECGSSSQYSGWLYGSIKRSDSNQRGKGEPFH